MLEEMDEEFGVSDLLIKLSLRSKSGFVNFTYHNAM